VVENLFVSLEYERALDASLKIKTDQKLLPDRSGTLERQTFGLRPYIYYELWELYPIIDLKFETFFSQSQSSYELKSAATGQLSSTSLDSTNLEVLVRIGVRF
jgi:hypothetical protein